MGTYRDVRDWGLDLHMRRKLSEMSVVKVTSRTVTAEHLDNASWQKAYEVHWQGQDMTELEQLLIYCRQTTLGAL